jgi:uncharacterized protein
MELKEAIEHGELEQIRICLNNRNKKQLNKEFALLFSSIPPSEVLTIFLEAEPETNALSDALEKAAQNGWMDTVQQLIPSFDNLMQWIKEKVLGDALNKAVSSHHLDIVKLLINAGADVNSGFKRPVFTAAVNGHPKLVVILIKAGAKLDYLGGWTSRYPEGQHPLLAAIMHEHINVIKALIESGCNINFATLKHRTPLEFARHLKKPAVIEFLEKAGATEVQEQMLNIVGAATRGFPNRVIQLYSESEAKEQQKALRAAIENGHDSVIQAMATVLDTDGNITGLCVAAGINRVDLIKQFLNADADINGYVGRDYPALLYAARANAMAAVEFLIKKGSDVNKADFRGETPLHIAAERGHLEIINKLVDSGANLKVKDDTGRTPLHMAKEYRQKKAATLIRRLTRRK